ncbi:MAG: hypothetical protein WCJ49_08410 [Deltaproteobacteria bacterium]
MCLLQINILSDVSNKVYCGSKNIMANCRKASQLRCVIGAEINGTCLAFMDIEAVVDKETKIL